MIDVRPCFADSSRCSARSALCRRCRCRLRGRRLCRTRAAPRPRGGVSRENPSSRRAARGPVDDLGVVARSTAPPAGRAPASAPRRGLRARRRRRVGARRELAHRSASSRGARRPTQRVTQGPRERLSGARLQSREPPDANQELVGPVVAICDQDDPQKRGLLPARAGGPDLSARRRCPLAGGRAHPRGQQAAHDRPGRATRSRRLASLGFLDGVGVGRAPRAIELGPGSSGAAVLERTSSPRASLFSRSRSSLDLLRARVG